MKKIIVLVILLIVVSALFLVPATIKKTVQIKAPLFNVYNALSKPDYWEQWRTDLRQIAQTDSNRISIKGKVGQFVINNAAAELSLTLANNIFHVEDGLNNNKSTYDYTLIPNKDPNKINVEVYKETNILHYLINGISKASFEDTHIGDLKAFFETDSLRYGYAIHRTNVPGINMIESQQEVLAKDKFHTVAQLHAALLQYAQANNARQTQPLVALFLPKGRDSVLVHTGLFIDKKLAPAKGILSAYMPKGGVIYTMDFKGRFEQREKAYDGLHQYFTDHGYQLVVLPFEMYLDNKLPLTDTDRINIRISFASYF